MLVELSVSKSQEFLAVVETESERDRIFFLVSEKFPPTHQECIKMIFDGGYGVQRRMEKLLVLKPDTLNNFRWTKIVRDRYRKLKYAGWM